VAGRLAAKGYALIAGARNVEKLNSLAEEARVEGFKLEATRPDQVDSCITQARVMTRWTRFITR
jgi:NADP-dependent 3-hydroxy acid dehydrogenase YdfG